MTDQQRFEQARREAKEALKRELQAEGFTPEDSEADSLQGIELWRKGALLVRVRVYDTGARLECMLGDSALYHAPTARAAVDEAVGRSVRAKTQLNRQIDALLGNVVTLTPEDAVLRYRYAEATVTQVEPAENGTRVVLESFVPYTISAKVGHVVSIGPKAKFEE